MKFIIDHANIDQIKEIYDYCPVDGVTTNPSILAANGKAPYETLTEIRDFIGNKAELHVQVVAADAAGMIEDAHRIQKELGINTFVKVPVTQEGLRAIKALVEEGANVTATAIYTPMQAFLAGKAGVNYTAPYVNRIDNLGADGIHTTKNIHDILKRNGLKAEVLAASFKNAQQMVSLCEYGIGACTITPDVIANLTKNDSVAAAVAAFTRDFEELCGAGVTMSNCN